MHLFYESPQLDVLFDSRSYDGSTYVPKGFFGNWMRATSHVAGKLARFAHGFGKRGLTLYPA